MSRSERQRTRTSAAIMVSLAAHLGVLFAFSLAPAPREPEPLAEPAPIPVMLVPPEPPPKPNPLPDGGSPPAAQDAPKPTPPKPEPPKPIPPKPVPAPRTPVRPPRAVPPPQVKALPLDPTPAADPAAIVSEAELAGAITVASGAGIGAGGSGSGMGSGSGAGAGDCDMVQRLQAALRRDPEVRAAVLNARRTAANPRAIRIWNGDWIRDQSQAGKGLAGLRQAIIMEVGFAPEACRDKPVRGLVLITFEDGPGGARIALGSGTWRWTDLLGRRGVRVGALS